MDENTLHRINDQTIENHKVVHDLRNALSPILLYAEILEASLAKLSLENEQQMARVISDSVKEMDSMIVERFGGEIK